MLRQQRVEAELVGGIGVRGHAAGEQGALRLPARARLRQQRREFVGQRAGRAPVREQRARQRQRARRITAAQGQAQLRQALLVTAMDAHQLLQFDVGGTATMAPAQTLLQQPRLLDVAAAQRQLPQQQQGARLVGVDGQDLEQFGALVLRNIEHLPQARTAQHFVDGQHVGIAHGGAALRARCRPGRAIGDGRPRRCGQQGGRAQHGAGTRDSGAAHHGPGAATAPGAAHACQRNSKRPSAAKAKRRSRQPAPNRFKAWS